MRISLLKGSLRNFVEGVSTKKAKFDSYESKNKKLRLKLRCIEGFKVYRKTILINSGI